MLGVARVRYEPRGKPSSDMRRPLHQVLLRYNPTGGAVTAKSFSFAFGLNDDEGKCSTLFTHELNKALDFMTSVVAEASPRSSIQPLHPKGYMRGLWTSTYSFGSGFVSGEARLQLGHRLRALHAGGCRIRSWHSAISRNRVIRCGRLEYGELEQPPGAGVGLPVESTGGSGLLAESAISSGACLQSQRAAPAGASGLSVESTGGSGLPASHDSTRPQQLTRQHG